MGDGVRAAFGVSGWILVGWAWADEIFGSKKRRPACPDGFSGSKKWHPGCRDWFPSDTKGHPGWADGLAGSAKKHPGTGDDPAMSAKLRPGRGNEFWASAQVRPGTADAFEGAQAARWGQTRPTKRGSRRRREESLTDFRAADGGCRTEWRLVTSSPTRKVAPATCGVRSAECGVRSAECGVRSACYVPSENSLAAHTIYEKHADGVKVIVARLSRLSHFRAQLRTRTVCSTPSPSTCGGGL